MRKLRNRSIIFLLSIVIALSLGTVVFAESTPDFDRICSITVSVNYGDDAVVGGTLSIYHVGEPTYDDGVYGFVPTEDFIASGETFSATEYGRDIAERLAEYAKNIAPLMTKEVGRDGKVTFDGLSAGLYLIVQNEAAEGYSKIAPFLVIIPYVENGVYVYDRSVSPKTEPSTGTEPAPETTEPTTETETAPDTEPTTDPDTSDDTEPTDTDTETDKPEDDPKLPQTGQLWWPVPILAFAGLLLFIFGMILYKKQTTDEN